MGDLILHGRVSGVLDNEGNTKREMEEVNRSRTYRLSVKLTTGRRTVRMPKMIIEE